MKKKFVPAERRIIDSIVFQPVRLGMFRSYYLGTFRTAYLGMFPTVALEAQLLNKCQLLLPAGHLHTCQLCSKGLLKKETNRKTGRETQRFILSFQSSSLSRKSHWSRS